MEKFVLHAFQNPLRLLFEFDITNQNYPRLHLRYLLLSNPGLGMGKLLIQSRVVVIYNFSETHYFTDHEKNPFCNMRNLF